MKNLLDRKVFVVDDNSFCLSLYTQHLKTLGFTGIQTFGSGLTCIDALTDEPFLMLLDHELGDMTGLDVIKETKKHAFPKYIIYISAQEDLKVVKSAIRMGVYDYIVKGDGDINKLSKTLKEVSTKI